MKTVVILAFAGLLASAAPVFAQDAGEPGATGTGNGAVGSNTGTGGATSMSGHSRHMSRHHHHSRHHRHMH